MGLREFEDTEGRSWRVWDTLPEKTTGLVNDYRSGWLTFDDGTERLRLAPVPEGWTTLPAERLALLLRVAHPTTARDPQEPAAERRVAKRRTKERRRRGDRRRNPPT